MAAKQNPVKKPTSHVKPHASAVSTRLNKLRIRQAQHAAACQRRYAPSTWAVPLA